MSPWRRKSKLIDKLQQKTGEPIGSVGTLGLMELLLERMWALLKWTIGIVLILFVFLIVLEVQLQRRNSQLDTVQSSASDAKVAAQAAEKTLNAAIEAQNNGQAIDPSAVASALEAVHRLEFFMCHGECPEPQQQGG